MVHFVRKELALNLVALPVVEDLRQRATVLVRRRLFFFHRFRLPAIQIAVEGLFVYR